MKWAQIQEQASEAISKAIKDTRGQSYEDAMKAVSGAYPFGTRMGRAYDIWLAEVRRQMDRRAFDERQLDMWEVIEP